MSASATSIACASSPRTAAMELVPAGAASAIALPRSTTALITCGAETDPAAANAAYSPTECGRLGCWQLGQGWIWMRASARCERRRPFFDFDSLTFGRAMNAGSLRELEG